MVAERAPRGPVVSATVRILVIGSGAREHAIIRALSDDPVVTGLAAAPGNPGTAQLATNHAVDPLDPAAVSVLAQRLRVGLVVIGPEAPLVTGVADAVRAAGIPCFGPGAAAARLEGSKAFAKEVMAAAEVPTAMAYVCTTRDEVAHALDAFGAPHVVKDDGLAAGKGVIVTDDRAEALAHAEQCLAKPVADGAVPTVVVEEFLDGPEASLFFLCDGTTARPLIPVQDFKRLGDGDTGPNTGGMGAYTPLPWAPDGLVAEVQERVADPVVAEMARRGTPFTGLLYCGLALTGRGLRVIEFNARFGDPETQSVLALLETPLGALLHATATGGLRDAPPLRWRAGAAVTVVLASEGYPATATHGTTITGTAAAEQLPGVQVLHAGTATDDTGRLVTAGGRVLCVVGEGPDLPAARAAAYAGVAKIGIDGARHRGDIAAVNDWTSPR